MYVCMYVTYVLDWIGLHWIGYIYMYVCIYVHMYVYVYMCVCLCVCICQTLSSTAAALVQINQVCEMREILN